MVRTMVFYRIHRKGIKNGNKHNLLGKPNTTKNKQTNMAIRTNNTIQPNIRRIHKPTTTNTNKPSNTMRIHTNTNKLQQMGKRTLRRKNENKMIIEKILWIILIGTGIWIISYYTVDLFRG